MYKDANNASAILERVLEELDAIRLSKVDTDHPEGTLTTQHTHKHIFSIAKFVFADCLMLAGFEWVGGSFSFQL